ncbi:MAG: DUF4197 domain-containing protein [Bacteroidales bacterium]|jgi:hypothetical protein|nr:DUF4197 domain-containing protein [Bacteroidales bacterium]
MKRLIILTFVFIGMCTVGLQAQTKKSKKTAASTSTNQTSKSSVSSSLSNIDITEALKEALTLGANESVGIASVVDGFYKNPEIFIPFPPEAKKMKDALTKLGMSKQIAEFEKSMNRAAEEAAKGALDVFVEAIKGMTIQDGLTILNGGETAATQYLRQKTYTPLKSKFSPIVKEAIDKVKVTSYWNPLMTTYNKLPRVKKQNPNLDEYITDKAIDGLMTLIAEQEVKIRKDPAAQVSDILRRVFGN